MQTAVLMCGGTIAMTTRDDGVRVPGDTHAVTELCQQHSYHPVTVTAVAAVDSARATPADWTTMLQATSTAADTGHGPVVLTHGTDTLTWTAALLAAARPWPVPVVLTAANTPAGQPGSDAETNIAAAFAAAETLPAGVYIAFAGIPNATATIFRGGYARKTSAEGQAFTSLGPATGHVHPDRTVTLSEAAGEPASQRVRQIDPNRNVHLIHCYPGSRHSRQSWQHVDHAVIETYPCGTVPDAAIAIAADAAENNVPVVAVPPAPLPAMAGVYESSELLTRAGAVLAFTSTTELEVVRGYLT